MEDLLSRQLKPIRETIETLSVKFENLTTSINDMRATADHADSNATEALTKVASVEKRVADLESALTQSRHKPDKLYARNLKLESYSRRDNLKFMGIPEQKDENCLNLVHTNLSQMGLDQSDINILRVHRLGIYKKNQRSPRPIIFRLATSTDRDIIWQKRSTLTGLGVWIKEDYPPEIDQDRITLWPYVKAARRGDPSFPDTRVSAYLRGDKLILNNHVYSVDNLEYLPNFVHSNIENPPPPPTRVEIK